MITDECHLERDARFEGVADGGGNAGIGNGDDHVRIHGMLAGEPAAELLAALLNGAAEDEAIGPGEIDVLEDAVLVGLLRGEMDGLLAGAGDAQHFAGLDVADVFRADEIEGAGFRGDHPGALEAAESERAEAAGVADGVELVAGEQHEGVGAFDLVEGIGESAGKISCGGARGEMDDDFRVAGGLENRAFVFHPAAQFVGIGEVAVVGQGQFAAVAVRDDGLGIVERSIAGGGIARVAHGGIAGKAGEDVAGKNFGDHPHAAMAVEIATVAGSDAGGFLAAMLEGIEAEVGEFAGFGVAIYPDDPAVVMQAVVARMRRRVQNVAQRAESALSSEPAQEARSASAGEETTSLPFERMRKVP